MALAQAQKAYEEGEVPIGAVIVRDGEVLGEGRNMTEQLHDSTAHAEMMALKQAFSKVGGGRLNGAAMYVTCEPCAMCAGALVWSKIERLYIGAMDPKAGGCGSVFSIPTEKRLNHQLKVETGLLEEECGALLSEFFKELRIRGKRWKK